MALRWYVEFLTTVDGGGRPTAVSHFEGEVDAEHPNGWQWSDIPSAQALQMVALVDDSDSEIPGSRIYAHEMNYSKIYCAPVLDASARVIAKRVGAIRGNDVDDVRVEYADNSRSTRVITKSALDVPNSEHRNAVAMPVAFRPTSART